MKSGFISKLYCVLLSVCILIYNCDQMYRHCCVYCVFYLPYTEDGFVMHIG